MKLVEFISLDSIHVDIDVDSKKNLFKCVSTIFSKNNSERASIVTYLLHGTTRTQRVLVQPPDKRKIW